MCIRSLIKSAEVLSNTKVATKKPTKDAREPGVLRLGRERGSVQNMKKMTRGSTCLFF